MDFYRIKERIIKKNGESIIEVYPDFIVGRSKDLMVQGKSFYSVWDEGEGLWSTDEYDVQKLVDEDLNLYVRENQSRLEGLGYISVRKMSDFSSNSWKMFRQYMSNISDSAVPLDSTVTFKDTEVKKSDYVSRRLSYSLQSGTIDAYNELIDVLYNPSERDKLEWAIGAIISGDARDIQKFIVLYGAAGTGKSTILNIIQKLFEGYYTTFEAKALVGSNNTFSTEVFRSNPLVAIQHDGDLSRIEDNTKLNSIVSHEEMTINEKHKPTYMARINAFLFMGTNKPVKITDAKSGIIRRMIDVHPTGNTVPPKRYQRLYSQINFELGAIAQHCLDVYRRLGADYYSNYRSVEMILQTDVFFNYVDSVYDIFKVQDGVSLKQAYELYKVYCDESNVEFRLPMYKFREELKNYFSRYFDRHEVDGVRVRSYYEGFIDEKFYDDKAKINESVYSLVMDSRESLLDRLLADEPAQYANKFGTPVKRWADVTDTLGDIDTSKLHYVKLPPNHIVIDFDIKNEKGEKDSDLNLEAASKWPSTYSEWSKSGKGIHLHYYYNGDTDSLSRIFDENIEIKVFNGDASLRRQLTASNNVPVTTLTGGLPLKEKRMFNKDKMMTERGLHALILRNLNKEIHPGTKPSIDFIDKILKDAYESGMKYDLSVLRPSVMKFALGSTNQSSYCIRLVNNMKFSSEERDDFDGDEEVINDKPLIIFDLEVYPNLFVISWKHHGEDREIVTWYNPSPTQVESLMSFRLVGYNNRKYDNHILYAATMGYNNQQLYALSKRIINNDRQNSTFASAYGLSYADIYDISTKKQSLKKWQLELGLEHMEIDLPWDEPVEEKDWERVGKYCENDVISTEVVWDTIHQDVAARKVLSDLSGLSVNDTTRAHMGKIMFGNEKNPQGVFVYTDLAKEFIGYKYDFGTSTYRGEVTGEGGYVYSEPGIYENVAVLDIASMHPTTMEILNLFGPYTKTLSEIKNARLAVKNHDYDKAKSYLNGRLEPYLTTREDEDSLSNALKLVINSVYGLTAASFPNPFRDERNIDNIVAKRGALFMIDLKHAVMDKGYQVVHIKTDSIKIPNANPEIIDFVISFGKKYGYDFELEDIYKKFCLINDAVFVAKTQDDKWTATGAQFKHPYVFKHLFSKEPIEFEDLCEVKTVTTGLYLDMNEGLPEDEHNYVFIGRAGMFCPVAEGVGGGILLRKKDDHYDSAAGAKGYRWMEAGMVKELDLADTIDYTYFDNLANSAITNISKFGSFEGFVSDDDSNNRD